MGRDTFEFVPTPTPVAVSQQAVKAVREFIAFGNTSHGIVAPDAIVALVWRTEFWIYCVCGVLILLSIYKLRR